ncbi:dynactin subunit 4 [Plakobranchus ocellatus]|uniref:Dynactin subunit 4 n=1 Tax=Plakobranchus ocellatus TaxID=259542 RepID=A0AAV3YL01_9GAST|nr:dynactin subunit 4 [Plakobranchus ocellatus]
MATYADLDLVKYLCSCGKKFPLCRLYLCKHCLQLRCTDCVQHEVDTPYCPHCLEHMPIGEAKLKKNRCSSCFDCPVCGHTLITRATSHTSPSPDDPTKMIAKKMYYMACGFCRWTTRDVGLPDQSVASSSWPVLQSPNDQRIFAMLETYKVMAQIEKAEHERKKYVSRRTHLYRQDKYGGSTAGLRRKGMGMSTFSSMR